MPASNMSVQPADTDSEGRLRPSMKQDDHPEHNMPESDHDGSELKVGTGNLGLQYRMNASTFKKYPRQ